MNSFEEEKELIYLLKSKDLDGFRKIVEVYQEKLLKFILSRISNFSEAEDLLQESFFKIWKNADFFDEKKSTLKTWVYSITKNTITDFLRKRKLNILSFGNLLKLQGKGKIDGSVFENEESLVKEERDLFEALKRLKGDEREIIHLRYFSELSIKEISEVLKMNENTVKTKIKRALEKMKVILEDEA